MIEGSLHHVSSIVPDEERVHELAEILGLKLGRRQFVEAYEADCIFMTGTGGVIEFIIPKSGKLTKFNKGVGGLHHIAIGVSDLEATKRQLTEMGIPLLETTPVDAGPICINFLVPAYTRGVIVEYMQQVEVPAAEAADAALRPAVAAPTQVAALPAGGGLERVHNESRLDEQQLFKLARLLRGEGRGEEVAVPGIRFRPVGQCPPDMAARWRAVDGVEVAGYVDDVAAEYARASVVVAPVFSGGGTQIKVLEALAYECGAVVSAFSAAGFAPNLLAGEHLLVAHDAAEWVAHCLALIDSPTQAERLGRAGRAVVLQKYSFDGMASEVKASLSRFREMRR